MAIICKKNINLKISTSDKEIFCRNPFKYGHFGQKKGAGIEPAPFF